MGCPDHGSNFCRLLIPEVPVITADNSMLGMTAGEMALCSFGNTWAAAEQEDAIAVPCVLKIMRMKSVPFRFSGKADPKRMRPAVGADPVVENDRVTQDGAKILVLRSHVQEATICKGDNGGAIMLKSSIKQSHRLCCRTDRNRDTQNGPRLCTTNIFI